MGPKEKISYKRELKSLKESVKHPFIIQYIEDLKFVVVGKDIKKHCIITGFASEGDLENVLKK